MADLELKNVNKIYDKGVIGVDALSFKVRSGEILTLLGGEGAGKTTALFMIAGLLDITKGELLIGGERKNDTHISRRNTALMSRSQFMNLRSVRSNLAYGLIKRGVNRQDAERRVEEAAQQLGILDVLSVRMGKVKGLTRSRCALARALIRKPDVFLLDDPFFGLNEDECAQLAGDIVSVCKSTGAAFVAATDRAADATLLGGEIVIMRYGKMLEIGNAEQLLTAPQNLYTAAMMEAHIIFRKDEQVISVPKDSLRLLADDGSDEDEGSFAASVAAVSDGMVRLTPRGGGAEVLLKTCESFFTGDSVKVVFDANLAIYYDNDGKIKKK